MTADTHKLPPGPSGSRIGNTLQIIRNPQRALERWRRQYGDPFYVHALNGPIVVTGRPDLIRQIFSEDPSHFQVFGQKALQPILGAGSMLMLDGAAHRRERKLIMPMFHGDRMKAYGQIMQSATLGMVETVLHRPSIEILPLSTQISLQVIVRAIFGGEETETIDRLMTLARTAIDRSLPIFFFSPKMQFRFLGLSPWDRFLRAQLNLREALDQEMRRRQETNHPRDDILSMLLSAEYEDGTRMDLEHAYDELGTFLFAGHETSAIAIAWAVYYLLSNSDKLETLLAELRAASGASPADLAQLPYLKAVVQESLRLNPIVTEVLRVLNTTMQLDDYLIPPGVAVAPAAILAHYDSQTYQNPNAFLPERFLEKQFSASEYLPFGGGARRCAGAAFASYEIAIVLGTLFSNFRLQLLETSPVVPKRRNITMGPSTGVRVSVSPL